MPLPGAPSQFKSFKVMTCDKSPTSNFLASSFLLYTQRRCGGLALPYASLNDIPSGCNVMHDVPVQISCQSTPIYLAELWPTVDIYLGDKTCDGSALTVAVKPGCFQADEYGFGMKCMAADTLMALQMFDSDESCAANGPSNYLAVPTDFCLPVGMTNDHWDAASKLLKHSSMGIKPHLFRGLREKAPNPPLEVSQLDGEQKFYYKARCNGN